MARLQDLTFTYDPMGNITHVADGATSTVFFNNAPVSADGDYTYDALYRLVRAEGREHPGQQPQWEDHTRYGIPHPNDTGALIRYAQEYSYDEASNILQMAHSATNNAWTQDYAYASDSNRLTQTQIGQTPLSYPHDAHGNMTLPHLTVQGWDHFDRLQKTSTQSVQSGTPETTYYVYDSSGQRVRKVTENYAAENETPTRKNERIYLGGFEIYREYASGVVETERQSLHVLDDPSAGSGQAKQRIALVETLTVDEGSEITSPTSLSRYQLTSHLNSPCVEVDETGFVISFEEYYPFGGTSFHSATTAIPKRYRYTGKERDDETGLYYYGARYYASWLGRWTAADPYGLKDGTNVFVYVKNSPVIYFDPDGREALSNRQLLGVDEASLNRSIQADPSMSNVLKLAAKKTAYDMANVLTAGFATAHDKLFEAKERGEISTGEYARRTGIQGLKSVAIVSVSALTGGAAGKSASAVGNIVRGAATGAATSASLDAASQTVDIAAGEQKSFDLERTKSSALTGALFGAGGAAAREIKMIPARRLARNAAKGNTSEERVLVDMGLEKNTKPVTTSEGKAIPDAMNENMLVEIKDAAHVTATKQVRIETDAAKASGKKSLLVTGENTHISEAAKGRFTRVILRPDLGPKK